jgi:glycosyltransferase involved in cell wall biosynthesis
VDDCSPDHSIEILERVMERYPQRKAQTVILRMEENRGVGFVRKTLLEKATGDYITFVDSDDFVAERMVELLTAKAQETKADVIDGGFAYFAGGQAESSVMPSSDSQSVYLKKLLLQHVVTHQLWARLISRKYLIDRQLSFLPGTNMAEDYSMVPRMMLNARWATVGEVVYYYRIDREGTFTNTHSRHHVVSALKANATVADYFMRHDTRNEYRTPLQIGLLLAFSSGGAAGIPYEEMQNYCPYQPAGLLFRCCHYWLRKGGSWKLVGACYRMMKRLYCIKLKFA